MVVERNYLTRVIQPEQVIPDKTLVAPITVDQFRFYCDLWEQYMALGNLPVGFNELADATDKTKGGTIRHYVKQLEDRGYISTFRYPNGHLRANSIRPKVMPCDAILDFDPAQFFKQDQFSEEL